MHLIKIVIAFCLIRKSLQKVEFYEEKKAPVNQISCLNIALKAYIRRNQNIQIFSSNSSNPFNSLLKIPFFVITDWNLLDKLILKNSKATIIFLEGNSDNDFNELNHLQGMITAKPILILCITDEICSSEMYMKKIIIMQLTTEQLNYVALNEHGIIDMYEYTTTAEGSCGIPQLLRRGQCSDKSAAEKVFPTLLNFHKCPLRVTSWPCSRTSPCSSDNFSNQLCGYSGFIVKVIAEKLNATPILRLVDTPKEVRRRVARRDADLGFGGLDNRYYGGISYSKPYMYVQATVVAPQSTWIIKQLTRNIFKPLGNEVWVGIGVVVVLIFFTRCLVPHFRRIHALQLFGIFLGIPVPRQPQRLPRRIFFLSLVIFAYLCSQSYLTNLTKVLSTPRLQKIKTLRDLENSKVQVTGLGPSRERFVDYPRIYRDYRVMEESMYYSNLSKLLQGRSESAYYIEDFDKNIAEWKAVEALSDRINWYSIALAVPNSSGILTIINKVVINVQPSGISVAADTFESMKCPEDNQPNPTSSQNSEKFEHDKFESVFILLIGGLTLSCFVFLIEIITAFVKNKKLLNERDTIRPKLIKGKPSS